MLIAPLAFRALLMQQPADEDDYLRRLTAATVAAVGAARFGHPRPPVDGG